MRELDARGIEYTPHWYAHKKGDSVDGLSVCDSLGLPYQQVFKTLVTQANTGEHIVYMIPVDEELDLKKCASAAHVKSVQMIPMKQLTNITGYIRGGCSPIKMKKQFPTYLDERALNHATIYFSAGKIGSQIECDPNDLIQILSYIKADLVK